MKTLGEIISTPTFFWISIFLGAAIIMFLFGDSFFEVFERVRPYLSYDLLTSGVIFFILVFFASVLRTLRWMVILGKNPSVGFLSWFSAYNLFFFLGSLTPLKSGELIKISWLKKRGTNYSSGVSGFLVERLMDLCGIFLATLFSLIFILQGQLLFLTAILVCFAFAIYCLQKRSSYEYLQKILKSFLQELHRKSSYSNLKKWGRVRRVFRAGISKYVMLLTLVIWIFHFLSFSFLLDVLTPRLGLEAPGVIMLSANLGAFLAVLPASLGTYELAGIIGFKLLGLDFSESFLSIALIHLISIISFFILAFTGVLFFIWETLRARF